MIATNTKRLKALLATARVANVPSVVSNVWVGAVVAPMMVGKGSELNVEFPEAVVWWLAAVGVCLYVAGNFLNDWYDREWDVENRPERALPGGLFCPSTYLAVAAGLVIMAGACAWMVNAVALGIAGIILVFVVAYTVLHKRTGWGVVWIGLCRALLVALGFVGITGCDEPLVMAGLISIPLFCYIVGLSVSARSEARGLVPKRESAMSLCLLALPVVIVWGCLCIVTKAAVVPWAAIPFAMWVVVCYRRRRNIPRYVAGLLAGIPLVDFMVLSSSVYAMAGDAAIWIIDPLAFLAPLVAFVVGLLLQRVAPAS